MSEMVKEMIPRPLPAKAQLHLAYEDNAKLRDRIAALEAQLAASRKELSGIPGELRDKIAEAIRGDGTSLDDVPWETLPEERKDWWREDADRVLSAIKDYLTPAPVVPAPEAQHTDDKAVDRFAAAMKRKLAQKREEGRGGWDDPEQCSAQYLSNLLRDHVEKGDPLDVGNLAMMLHQRGERISPAPEAQQEPVAWQEPELTCPHIERAVMSGELSPAVVDELAAIREINSQLRYGTWALKAQLQALPRPAEQAVTEAMVEAGAKAIVACRFEDESEPVTDYDLELSRSALKAAMEAPK